MVWIIAAIVILAISVYFANEYRLDRKAHRLRDGSEEDRRLASELQDIARNMDEGNTSIDDRATPAGIGEQGERCDQQAVNACFIIRSVCASDPSTKVCAPVSTNPILR